MAFADQNWDVLLPSYLTSETKGRLKSALTQFHPTNRSEISYEDFYRDFGYNYFLQGDIILEIRTSEWNIESRSYEKAYLDALILSSTCDISFDNQRGVNPKQCLFAPLIDLDVYLADLSDAGYNEQKIDEFKKNVKAQSCSNLFYLPKVNDKDKERIALLDHIFWYPIDELKPLIETIQDERIASLNQLGFYLLVFKLSYHFCRLPEQYDREA